MKRMVLAVIIAVSPLLTAALWMDRQPSLKPYQAPVLRSPEGSVPVAGHEAVSPDSVLKNPQAATAESLAQGMVLFTINCAMCHGQTSAERGPVGRKLKPPPPGLDHDQLKRLDDGEIFKAITFGFGRMPHFRDKLTTHERWHLINFLRTRK